MLTLARALAAKPVVLLIDELSLGLAPLVVRRLFRALKEAVSQGVAVILVEQQMMAALEIADRAYVLRHGHIALEGSSTSIRGRIGEVENLYLSQTVASDGNKRGEAHKVRDS